MRRIVAFAAVVAFSTGCESSGPAHGPPATVVKTAGDALQVAAGEQVSPAPRVLVTDAEGRPVRGAVVAFVVATGGGTVSGATPTTDQSGVASVGSWTIGTVAGGNALSATVGTLDPVTFTVTGIAGIPASIEKTAGDGGEANLGASIAPKPTVRITDIHGNPAQGVNVTFAVASGGGSATGTAQTTNADGEATVGSWTLGSSAGVNTLTANAGTLATVTFSATAADMCERSPDYTIGSTTPGTLTTGDCALSTGHNVDKYTITRSALTAFRLDQKSSAIDSRLVFFSLPTHRLVQSQTNSMDALMYFISGAGSLQVGASSTETGVNGAYTLESALVAESITNCVTAILVNNPTTSQSIQPSDCDDVTSGGTYDYDGFVFFAEAGRTYTVSMTTSAFDPYFEIQTLNGVLRHSAWSTGSGTRTADVTFTPSASEHRFILASTFNIGQSGAYTLTISSTPAGAATASSANDTEGNAATPSTRFSAQSPDLRRLRESFSVLADSARTGGTAQARRGLPPP